MLKCADFGNRNRQTVMLKKCRMMVSFGNGRRDSSRKNARKMQKMIWGRSGFDWALGRTKV